MELVSYTFSLLQTQIVFWAPIPDFLFTPHFFFRKTKWSMKALTLMTWLHTQMRPRASSKLYFESRITSWASREAPSTLTFTSPRISTRCSSSGWRNCRGRLTDLSMLRKVRLIHPSGKGSIHAYSLRNSSWGTILNMDLSLSTQRHLRNMLE